ncbi:MAG TPA: 16S rRNA (guanine(966)-N(2))-methyltransferase RsmD [Stellaceae bacterium]|jgi:16S rRNA (guanine966-N2)-methyltransferase|nr:16S rRNA (guanine(966)-N(2))-methyltransferase RsmD [Stellaceae bacterium]
MRIIAGKHRGRKLLAPEDQSVRPTAERAREALFDILAHGRLSEGPAFADALVLDAFAGTGAFGLEALSRGARRVTFIEKDRAARALLEQNIAALGEGKQAQVLPGDATRPPRASGACSLAFLDPPYREDLAAPALRALAAMGWLAKDALVIIELAARANLEPPAGFEPIEERRYGAAKFVFLRYAA